MKKSTSEPKPSRRGQTRSTSKAEQKVAIKMALEQLDALVPETPKLARLIVLLRSWLTDESGYDERTMPKLMKALDEERDQAGARRLFDG
ncbi:MAG: hypothetical protein ACYC3I_10700 [Gemmataceae bacterium]